MAHARRKPLNRGGGETIPPFSYIFVNKITKLLKTAKSKSQVITFYPLKLSQRPSKNAALTVRNHAQRPFRRKGIFIHPFADQRVVHVHQGDDLGPGRAFVAFQAIRVSLSIPPSCMAEASAICSISSSVNPSPSSVFSKMNFVIS